MERMSKIKTTYIYDDETDTAELTELEEVGMSDYKKEFDLACEKIVKLEEENKKLKAEKDKLYIDYENLSNCNTDLIQENKKLKEENEELKEYKSMYEGLCK